MVSPIVGHVCYPIMGTVVPGDDKELKPLQAADFLAGQARVGKVHNIYPTPLRMMANAHLISYHEMDAKYLKEQFIDRSNEKAWS